MLSPNVSAYPWDNITRTPRGRIMCEIAERMIEWSEIEKREHVYKWLSRVATIGGDAESSEAMWLYLRLSTGDLGQITASYSELGAGHNRTKQAQEQETQRALRVIKRHFPELACAIDQLIRPDSDERQDAPN